MVGPGDTSNQDTFLRIKEIVFNYAVTQGSFTIPKVAELSGYSTTTVARHIGTLLESGLIAPVAEEESHRKGRRATLYSLEQAPVLCLGVDIKSYELGIGLMDMQGNLVKKEIDTQFKFENTHRNLDTVLSKVEAFISSLGDGAKSKIAGANFNFGGRVDSRQGISASLYNFEETRETPMAELLSERLGLKVFIENDTKAMAYGEYIANGRKWQNVLYINIGWGLGLGIILDGKLYSGSQGFSGELGHVHYYDNNILCHCGKKGCMETEISGSAIHRKVVERIMNGEASVLSGKVRRGAGISINDIVEATEKEDPLCIDVVSNVGIELGKQLAGLINIFNPECIIIGGSVAKTAPYYFLQQTILAVRQYSLKLMSQHVSVITSRLGDQAGIYGACMIARDKVIYSLGRE